MNAKTSPTKTTTSSDASIPSAKTAAPSNPKTALAKKPKQATTKTHQPLRSQKKSKSTTKKPRNWKYDIAITVFYIAWALISTYAAQLVIAQLMVMLLGSNVTQPGWTLLYYLLSYGVALALILCLPKKLVQLYRSHYQSEQSAKQPANSDNQSPTSTEVAAASPASEKTYRKLEKDLSSTPESLGVQHLPTFIDIGLAPVGYFVYLVLASVLTQIMSIFTWFNVDQAQDVGFSYFITDLDRIFAMIAIVLVAPIAEELIMRGWLYGKLRSKWGIITSILLISVLFGLMHGQWNVAVSTFALSIILCSMREITGTIWSGMLLHILSNGIAFYLLYIAL